jgi:hypothetical protein
MTYDAFIRTINEMNGLFYSIGIATAEQRYSHLNDSNGTIIATIGKRIDTLQEDFMKFYESHFLIFGDTCVDRMCKFMWNRFSDAGDYSVFTLKGDEGLIYKALTKAEIEYKYLLKHIEENYTIRKKPIHICNRCHSIVRKKNVSKGYKYYCPECDEDLFEFETMFTDIIPKTKLIP